MNLGEMCFYVLTGLVLIFSFFVYLGVEDIKIFSIFKKMLIASVLILVLGLLLVLFDLNYLSDSRTILIYLLPTTLLLLNRILFLLNNNFFGEPFVYSRGGFLQGFWYHRFVDEKKLTLLNKIYYFYCTVLHFGQIFLFSMLFSKFK